MGSFSDRVFHVVCSIPAGKVSTYGQVARLMGSARSARYVGFALRNNPSPTALAAAGLGEDVLRFLSTQPEEAEEPTAEQLQQLEQVQEQLRRAIPCHRVVFADGRLCSGFAFGGPGVQRDLLMAEGVTFRDDDHVDLEDCLWDGRGYTPADTAESATAAAAADAPTAPPEGFNWEAELGEVD